MDMKSYYISILLVTVTISAIIPRKLDAYSIETIYGDVYDCIDVQKQPSLSHPALRGHKVMTRPEKNLVNFPTENVGNSSRSQDGAFKFEELWKSKKGCPKGTVPIRRENPFNKDWKNTRPNYTSNWDQFNNSIKLRPSDGLDFAGLITKPGKTYFGAKAFMNLYNPRVCSDKQFSSAIMFLEVGKSWNQIQVGWTVNPRIYHDYQTRLFTAWTGDNFKTTGCYNMHCPGFILVNNIVPLDYAFKRMSVVEGFQIDVGIWVKLDPTRGWWLMVGKETNHIGYWPLSLFPQMKQHVETIRWGGLIYTPSSDDHSPQMGSGKFANGEFDQTCYMRQLAVIDQTSYYTDVDNSMVDVGESRCFYVGSNGFKDAAYYRYSFLFGGGGGRDEKDCLYSRLSKNAIHWNGTKFQTEAIPFKAPCSNW